MSKRGKLSTEYSAEEIAKQVLDEEHKISYRDATLSGILTGLVVYLALFTIFFLLFLITGNSIIFDMIYPISLVTVAIFFFFAGTSIWFVPSPSWNRMKSTLFNQPFIPRTTSEGYNIGWNRIVNALILLLMVEIQRFIHFRFIS